MEVNHLIIFNRAPRSGGRGDLFSSLDIQPLSNEYRFGGGTKRLGLEIE